MGKKFLKESLLVILFIVMSSLITQFSSMKFLIFVVLAPLFYMTFNFKFPKNIILLFITSFLAYIISFMWVLEYNLYTFLLAGVVFILPFILTPLLFLFYERILKRKSKIGFILIISLFWVVLSKYFIFFWMNFAIFFPLSTPLIWLIKNEGITFLIVLFNGLLVLPKKRKIKGILAFLLVVIIFCSLFSLVYPSKLDKNLNVAIIQGNTNYSWYYRMNHSDEIFEMYKNLTLNLEEEIDLVIWPEYAILKDPVNDEEYLNNLIELSEEINASLILGAPVSENGPVSNTNPRYDAAFFIEPNNSWDLRYAEAVPIKNGKLITVENSKTFSKEKMSIGIILCWEETQLGVVRKIINQEVDIMVSLSNNQKFDNTRAIYIISLFSRLYAAENGIYWIRSTSTGITQIINPMGKVIKSLPSLKRNVLKHNFTSN